MKLDHIHEVIVIGGGPAGMMAAISAAQHGKQVLLLEKNDSLGKKLLITGGGRCNVTNNKPTVRALAEQYKGAGKFLFSLFSQFDNTHTQTWFTERGVMFKEENEGRMFPITDKAQTIFDTLYAELQKLHVLIKTKESVEGATYNKQEKTFTVRTKKHTYICMRCIVASGGTSRPETGSTGDGYTWMQTLGHTVLPNSYALVPLKIQERWIARLAGITMPEVKISVLANGKRGFSKNGKLLFTHQGVSGPTILNMSSTIGELHSYSTVTLQLDLFPNEDAGALKKKFQQTLTEYSNKKIVNALATLVPTALARIICMLVEIDESHPTHSVSTESRKKILQLLKALTLTVSGLLGADKAVISGGGVALDEIDFKTMQSKLIPGLFIIGDMLDIDRPSGGYSLQLCWSAGYVAGLYA